MNNKQRLELENIISKLEDIVSEEEDKLSNLEENFSGTERYGRMEEGVTALEEAIENIQTAMEDWNFTEHEKFNWHLWKKVVKLDLSNKCSNNSLKSVF